MGFVCLPDIKQIEDMLAVFDFEICMFVALVSSRIFTNFSLLLLKNFYKGIFLCMATHSLYRQRYQLTRKSKKLMNDIRIEVKQTYNQTIYFVLLFLRVQLRILVGSINRRNSNRIHQQTDKDKYVHCMNFHPFCFSFVSRRRS